MCTSTGVANSNPTEVTEVSKYGNIFKIVLPTFYCLITYKNYLYIDITKPPNENFNFFSIIYINF